VKTQEICESCFSLLENIFNLRNEGIKKMLSKIEEIYNLTDGKKGQ